MKPPYELTSVILKLVSNISEKIGAVNERYLDKPSPQLRKQNKIKTIHNSLKIEGNTLTLDQVTGILENKRVIGPQKDIQEVANAIEIYEHLDQFDAHSPKSFLRAHSILMMGLVEDAGRYRRKGVGVVKGGELKHLAPPHENVSYLMNDLFLYLKESEEHALVKSCVFHYEMEFIHPFLDGNGRMGRLWQTLILYQAYTVFEFLPFESIISQTQDDYYRVLAECDKMGHSTRFIEYMLQVIDASLTELLEENRQSMSTTERLSYFLSSNKGEFTRKAYLSAFPSISTATASRDLKTGVEMGLIERFGEKNKSSYVKSIK